MVLRPPQTQQVWKHWRSGASGQYVYGLSANGINYNFSGGTDQYSGYPTSSANYDTQRSHQAYAKAAHQYGIKVLGFLPNCNIYWSTETDTNPAPMLGSWKPSFTDSHGQTWDDWYQTMADLGDALEWMGFDGLYFDNEDTLEDQITWAWRYNGNNYGETSSLAQEAGWAKTAGAKMMAAFNSGRTELHAANGNNYPVYCYVSVSSARDGSFPGGYLSHLSAHQGTEWQVYEHGLGQVTQSVESALLQSVYMYFMTGMASETTGKVVLGDPTFYDFKNVVGSNTPFYRGTTQAEQTTAWHQALAYNADGFAKVAATLNAAPGAPGGLSIPSNVYVTPMIWLADGPAGGQENRNQAAWDAAKPAILANLQGNTYLIFQYLSLTHGVRLTLNYADNTYSGAEGANYTPLDSTHRHLR